MISWSVRSLGCTAKQADKTSDNPGLRLQGVASESYWAGIGRVSLRLRNSMAHVAVVVHIQESVRNLAMYRTEARIQALQVASHKVHRWPHSWADYVAAHTQIIVP